ncbi:MAG: dihydrofolate reductase family protein [Pseudomonadales bacterium]
MTTGHVYIAASLDGFIARRNGDLDWLMKQPAKGEDYGYDEFMDSVDGLIMGRGSFEKVLTFDDWPYTKTVVVMSQSLSARDLRKDLVGKVRIVSATPKQLMQTLFEEGWQRAYVDGGQIIQAFLRDGLIRDITLTRIPILLGDGIPLFGPLDRDIDLKHLETKAYSSGLVHSKYEVVG